MAANRATVSVSASVGPDEMKASVGGTIVYDLNDMAGDACNWIYFANDIDTSSEVIIPADVGFSNNGITANSSPNRTASSDCVEFLVLKHSGFQSDGSTVSTANLAFNFTHGVAAADAVGNLYLEPGDVWWGRFIGSGDSADFTAISLGSGDIKLLIYAVLDDV
tara:strand:- start:566 stop:1057 length:492 start_codon:yes stop_codon:yes gene_type:complete